MAEERKIKERIYRSAIIFSIAFALLHLISLPIGITYDGFQYVDGADVLGSPRFPADWYRNRTPLYPLILKISFWLLGHQALAVIVVSTVMGLGTVLLLGRAARLVAGEWCGTIVLLLLTLYPTAVAYQHLALTETGTSFFIALVITIALLEPQTAYLAWRQAALFALVLAAGYYWRQLLLQLAPMAALFWLARNWKLARPHGALDYPALARVIIAAVLIVVAPIGLSHLWDSYADRDGLAEITLRQSIVRQALLAPTDLVVGENKEAYINAVRESSSSEGNFFSGVRNDLFDPLFDQTFRNRPMGTGDTKKVFLTAIRQHPSRYFSGVFRTLCLFAGARATVNENRIFREQILSPTWTGSKIGDGPPATQVRIKHQFQQLTTSSAVSRVLWALCFFYDFLLVAANILTIFGLAYFLLTRNFNGVAVVLFPLAYVALYAFILASIDRFALPAYPAILANAVILPAVIWQQFTKAKEGGRRWAGFRAIRSGSGAPAKPANPYSL